MLLPAVQQVRGAARRTTSINNIRQLILSCHNFESAYQSLPAAYSKDEDGKPLLSWRVHLLPFLEEAELYEQFHLDEPWDSPHNKSLIEKMPEVFSNPNHLYEPGKTSYLGVAGKAGIFAPPSKASKSPVDGVNFRDIADGTANTILILETNQENSVTWTKPDDINADEVKDILAICQGQLPAGQINVGFADGSCRTIGAPENKEILKMLTKDGGEELEVD